MTFFFLNIKAWELLPSSSGSSSSGSSFNVRARIAISSALQSEKILGLNYISVLEGCFYKSAISNSDETKLFFLFSYSSAVE